MVLNCKKEENVYIHSIENSVKVKLQFVGIKHYITFKKSEMNLVNNLLQAS